MRLKEMVMEALRTADRTVLERLVVNHPRANRFVVGRLWDPDEEIRQRAARALGALAEVHPELGIEVVRRLIWALNDESATNGVYGLPALGEIGYRAPGVIEPFVGPMASLAWDERLRDGIVRALARIAESAPELVEPYRDLLASTTSPESSREEKQDGA